MRVWRPRPRRTALAVLVVAPDLVGREQHVALYDLVHVVTRDVEVGHRVDASILYGRHVVCFRRRLLRA